MRTAFASASLGILLATALAGEPAEAQSLRFNQITPASHFFHHRLLVPWAKEVEQATGGRVKIEFTGSSLGPMPRQFDLALNGIADITTGNQAAIPGRFPMTLITELPFVSDSAEAMSVALWRVHEKHLAKADEYEGTKLLTLFTSGPSHIFTTEKQITSLDDMNGMKLRVSGITLEKMAKTFGAVTIATPVSEIYEVISKGVVDGTITTDTSISGWKVEKFIRYQTIVPGGLSYGPFFIVMNQRKWDSISPQDQAAIMSLSGEKLARRAGRIFDEEDRKSVDARKDVGTKVTRAQGALLEDMHKRLAFVEEDWVKAANAKGIDGRAAVDMLRAEAAKAH